MAAAERDHLVFRDDHFLGQRVDDVDAAHPPADRLHQADLDLFSLVDDPLRDALRRAAVFRRDHDVLGHVGKLSGQVTAVGRLECRVRQALSGTVRRAEVLEHRQPFAEIGLDRRLDDLARGLGHQAPHAGQLANLLDAAAGSRFGHQEDRIQIRLTLATVGAQASIISGRDPLASMRPGVEHLVVAFLVRDDPPLIEPVLLGDFLLGLSNDRVLRERRLEIIGGE